MVKKIRRQDEGERPADGPGHGAEGVDDSPGGGEDEKAEERSTRDGSFDEKKAANPGPSGG